MLSCGSAVLIAATLAISPMSAAQAAPTSQAAPAVLPDGWNYILSAHSGLYMAVGGGVGANGDHVLQWSRNGGLEQQWRLINPPGYPSNVYVIVNATTGRALSIPGGSTVRGAHAIVWNRNNGPEQRWHRVDAGAGTFYLVNEAGDQCLAIPGASTVQGTHLVQWPCNGQREQIWYLAI